MARRSATWASSCVTTCAPIVTNCSSPPRPATTCGPDPTATTAAASTCLPRSTRASSAWGSTTWTSSTTTAWTPRPRSRRRWVRWRVRLSRVRRSTWAFRAMTSRRFGPPPGSWTSVTCPTCSTSTATTSSTAASQTTAPRPPRPSSGAASSPSRHLRRACSQTATSTVFRPIRAWATTRATSSRAHSRPRCTARSWR